jgi:uncharacterized protein HemX
LDLSSLSDEDADDLGIPRPSESPGEAAVRRAKEDYPTGRPKKHGKGGVIVAAILIVLCLIGGAGYAYWQNSKETPVPAPTQTTKATTQTTTAKVTGKDVDSATKDIDASLNKVNDTTDFTTNDLSDATLGL